MYLAEAEEIFRRWRVYPPTHRMVAIIAMMLGWKAPSEPARAFDAASIADTGLPVAERSVHEGLGTPIFDFEELKRRYRKAG